MGSPESRTGRVFKRITIGDAGILPSLHTGGRVGAIFPDWAGYCYLLPDPSGNVLISGGAVDEYIPFFERHGGVARQLLTDHHFASARNATIFHRFNARLFCHRDEVKKVAGRTACPIAETISERTQLNPNLLVLPTPGHQNGSVCYLWQSPDGRRVLFSGDNFYRCNGRWDFWIAAKNVAKMIASLELVRELDFDVIAPTVGYKTELPLQVFVSPAEKLQIMDSMLARLRKGDVRRNAVA